MFADGGNACLRQVSPAGEGQPQRGTLLWQLPSHDVHAAPAHALRRFGAAAASVSRCCANPGQCPHNLRAASSPATRNGDHTCGAVQPTWRSGRQRAGGALLPAHQVDCVPGQLQHPCGRRGDGHPTVRGRPMPAQSFRRCPELTARHHLAFHSMAAKQLSLPHCPASLRQAGFPVLQRRCSRAFSSNWRSAGRHLQPLLPLSPLFLPPLPPHTHTHALCPSAGRCWCTTLPA